jgi:hypothetical protein
MSNVWFAGMTELGGGDEEIDFNNVCRARWFCLRPE